MLITSFYAEALLRATALPITDASFNSDSSGGDAVGPCERLISTLCIVENLVIKIEPKTLLVEN